MKKYIFNFNWLFVDKIIRIFGGLFIGIAETMVTAYGSSLYKDAIVYIILILILILKPAGLLGKNVREKV